jgi:hypothetical protein
MYVSDSAMFSSHAFSRGNPVNLLNEDNNNINSSSINPVNLLNEGISNNSSSIASRVNNAGSNANLAIWYLLFILFIYIIYLYYLYIFYLYYLSIY